MREIVFDTETTGLDPPSGDRMVEIGCIELVNRVRTGRTFHAYFNPEPAMPRDAEAVHGLSTRSSPTSRASTSTRSRNCSSSSAMRRWSRTTRSSTSASSTASSRVCGRP